MRRFLFIAFVCFASFSLASAAEVVDKIIAEVNGKPITYREITAPLAGRLEALREVLDDEEYEKEAARVIARALENRIQNMLFLSETKRRLSEEEISAAEREVEKVIQEAIAYAGSEEKLKSQLRSSGTTLEKETEDLKSKTLIARLLRKTIGPRIYIAPKEVLNYYRVHLNEFQETEKVKIRQILIKFSEYEKKDEARRVAEDLRKRLAEGADFATLAKKYSRGPYAEKGGEWEFLERGSLLPKVDSRAFSLPLGEVSEIIECDIGFSIIKVEGRKEARTIPLEEVGARITAGLREEKFRQEMDKYYRELRQKATVVIRLK